MSIRPRHTTSVHPTQAVSWFLLVMFVSTFYALFLLYLGTVGRAVVGVFYGLLVVCVVVCAAYGSLQDPADPHVYDAQDSESQVEAAALIASRSPSALRDISYCFRCERYVNTGSRHCTICQKCIGMIQYCLFCIIAVVLDDQCWWSPLYLNTSLRCHQQSIPFQSLFTHYFIPPLFMQLDLIIIAFGSTIALARAITFPS